MTHEERVFEMMKAISPVFVSKGVELQERIVAAGGNPEKCKVAGMSILEAQAQSAIEWAETLVKEFEK